MKVAFLSDLENLGGAGIAAARLANGLHDLGVEVIRLFNQRNSSPLGDPKTWKGHLVGLPRALEVTVNGVRRVAPRAGYLMGSIYSHRVLERALAAHQPDVFHVHGIHASYWNHSSLGHLDRDLPTVWTFHDNWGFAPESYRYAIGGKLQRAKPDGGDRERAQRVRRAYFESRNRCELVANSNATAEAAREAIGRPVEVIPYGIPLDIFSPIERTTARQALGLSPTSFVVGFSADNRSDPLKGFGVLQAALGRLSVGNVEAIALGEGSSGEERFGGVRVRLFGRVAQPRLLAILYSAADVFVVPSLAEALGLVAMESVACGTPVIASNVGGLPDVVVDGESGWLVPPESEIELANLLTRLATNAALVHSLRESCRRRALDRWTLATQARRYLAIYERLARSL